MWTLGIPEAGDSVCVQVCPRLDRTDLRIFAFKGLLDGCCVGHKLCCEPPSRMMPQTTPIEVDPFETHFLSLFSTNLHTTGQILLDSLGNTRNMKFRLSPVRPCIDFLPRHLPRFPADFGSEECWKRVNLSEPDALTEES